MKVLREEFDTLVKEMNKQTENKIEQKGGKH